MINETIYSIDNCKNVVDQAETFISYMIEGNYPYKVKLQQFDHNERLEFIKLAQKDNYNLGEIMDNMQLHHNIIEKMVEVMEKKTTKEEFFNIFLTSFYDIFGSQVDELLCDIGEKLSGSEYCSFTDEKPSNDSFDEALDQDAENHYLDSMSSRDCNQVIGG